MVSLEKAWLLITQAAHILLLSSVIGYHLLLRLGLTTLFVNVILIVTNKVVTKRMLVVKMKLGGEKDAFNKQFKNSKG